MRLAESAGYGDSITAIGGALRATYATRSNGHGGSVIHGMRGIGIVKLMTGSGIEIDSFRFSDGSDSDSVGNFGIGMVKLMTGRLIDMLRWIPNSGMSNDSVGNFGMGMVRLMTGIRIENGN